MSNSSLRHLCYWALLSRKDKSDAVYNLVLTKVASQGLVLDGSLGAGGTDEPFLYLRLTCKIRNIVYQTILLDLAVSLDSVKQRIRIY
jgi:hypothetical protein